jgi:hypothetical protein
VNRRLAAGLVIGGNESGTPLRAFRRSASRIPGRGTFELVWSHVFEAGRERRLFEIHDLTGLGARDDPVEVVVFDAVKLALALFHTALFAALSFFLLLLVADSFALAFFHAGSRLIAKQAALGLRRVWMTGGATLRS